VRQAKRLFYILLLNITVSAVTIMVILNLWERSHPPITPQSTPAVVIVTSTQATGLLVGSTQEETAQTQPTDTGLTVALTAVSTPAIETVTYRVKEGDTLGALASQFNVSVADIMTVNGLTDPDSISVGQILQIPTEPLPTITPTPLASDTPTITPRPSATSTRGPTQTATLTQPAQEAQVVITSVIGAGSLANEHVVLQRTGDGELSLAGWRLVDRAGNTYTFPQLTLYKGSTINLNTRQGEDTVLDLYWGLSSSVWKAGKTVYLYDAQDNLRASYTIP
jgi:LysM repeat protein